jgi:hypothetical protein
VSFNLGWPASEPAQYDAGHLRIRDLARRIEAADKPHTQDNQAIAQANHLRSSYDLSVQNIDENIYALAAATAALDRVEGKLFEARSQIEDLCRRGQPVDLTKVERTLLALANHINQSVSRADENYVNMLRDARLQIRISEVGGQEQRAKQVDLTLISLDKLIAWKLRDGPSDPVAWIELIDQMGQVTRQNVQILSSLILTLFAARDYTSEVVDLVIAPPADDLRRAGHAAKAGGDFAQSARAAIMDSGRRPDQGRGRTQSPPPPAKPPGRLMSFLKEVTFQA